MKTKVEGILLSKVLHQERNLICQILLRNGKKVSILFYGGSGGGKNKKSTLLEVGHMLKIELQKKKTISDIYTAKEWSLLWHHKKIRENFQAYYSMCFFLETISKVALVDDLTNTMGSFDDESIGNFRVLSNALVHLENSLDKNNFNKFLEIGYFFIKSTIEHGICPNIDNCVLCGIDLKSCTHMELMIDHGGFACQNCQPISINNLDGKLLFDFIHYVASKKYPLLNYETKLKLKNVEEVFAYFCYQSHIPRNSFKADKMALNGSINR